MRFQGLNRDRKEIKKVCHKDEEISKIENINFFYNRFNNITKKIQKLTKNYII